MTVAKTQKPCVALLGEFSAGKSTLANLMLGASPLPVQVIATNLPPVLVTYGHGSAVRIDTSDVSHPVDLRNLSNVPLDTTKVIRIERTDAILERCSILDMPGISDPNMHINVWERVLPLADAFVWCTHATQAWRQSEAAFWRQVDSDIQKKSILLVTRFDKLAGTNDRHRVLRRVQAEAGGHFGRILPIALLEAQDAGDDVSKWEKCGADAFAKAFASMVDTISMERNGVMQPPGNNPADIPVSEQRPKIVPRRVTRYAG